MGRVRKLGRERRGSEVERQMGWSAQWGYDENRCTVWSWGLWDDEILKPSDQREDHGGQAKGIGPDSAGS